jgi:hypothetical protein
MLVYRGERRNGCRSITELEFVELLLTRGGKG